MSPAATAIIVAHWYTTAENLPEVLASAAAAKPLSLAEPGCLGYSILQDTQDSSHVVLIEHYRDKAALEAHLNSAHYQDLIAGRVRPLLTERSVEHLQPRNAA